MAEVLNLYTSLPGTRGRPTRRDRKTAEELYRCGVTFATVKAGLLLATLRREGRTREEPLGPVGSLRYYLEAIREAQAQPQDPGYVEHLAAKIERLPKAAS